jgi:hypothetical protein
MEIFSAATVEHLAFSAQLFFACKLAGLQAGTLLPI